MDRHRGAPCRLSPVVAGLLCPVETVWDGRGNTFPPITPQKAPKKRPRNDRALLVIWSADDIAVGGDRARIRARADVAQLVEHLHGKEGVRGSSPLVGLAKNRIGKRFSCCPGDSWCSGGVIGASQRQRGKGVTRTPIRSSRHPGSQRGICAAQRVLSFGTEVPRYPYVASAIPDQGP